MIPPVDRYRQAVLSVLSSAGVEVRDIDTLEVTTHRLIPEDVPDVFRSLFKGVVIEIDPFKAAGPSDYGCHIRWSYQHPNGQWASHPIGGVMWDSVETEWQWSLETGQQGST